MADKYLLLQLKTSKANIPSILLLLCQEHTVPSTQPHYQYLKEVNVSVFSDTVGLKDVWHFRRQQSIKLQLVTAMPITAHLHTGQSMTNFMNSSTAGICFFPQIKSKPPHTNTIPRRRSFLEEKPTGVLEKC